MKNLELSLEKVGSFTLRASVKEQSETLSGSVVYTMGVFSLRIYNRPEMTQNSLYLRGKSSQYDNAIVAYLFETKKERDDMYDFLVRAQEVLNGENVLSNSKKHPTGFWRYGDSFYGKHGLVCYLKNDIAEIHLYDGKVIQLQCDPRRVSTPLEKVLKDFEYAGNIYEKVS